MQYMYVGRKLKKRDMRKVRAAGRPCRWDGAQPLSPASWRPRQLWITRINNAARQHTVSYSRFMDSLVKAEVALNRKVLSELAMHEPHSFKALADLAKQRQAETQSGLKALLK